VTLSPAALDRCAAAHRSLAERCAALRIALERDDPRARELLWGQLAADVCAHFDDELTSLLGPLFEARARDAQVMMQEQRQLRCRLTEIGRVPPARSLGSFLDELEAHLRREDRTVEQLRLLLVPG
jgi:hypothetical protein